MRSVSLSRPVSARRTAQVHLVELLVVITIIGILIALLLPVVQASREAGRRINWQATCGRSARQSPHHVEAYGSFPPGATLCSDPSRSWCSSGTTFCVHCQGPNWNHYLIQHLDLAQLYADVLWCGENYPKILSMRWSGDPRPITWAGHAEHRGISVPQFRATKPRPRPDRRPLGRGRPLPDVPR